jgi:hypothetical protein
MSIQPKGEDLRKATRWISEQRKADPDKRVSALVESASIKFDLSPRDESFLLRFTRDNDGKAVN